MPLTRAPHAARHASYSRAPRGAHSLPPEPPPRAVERHTARAEHITRALPMLRPQRELCSPMPLVLTFLLYLSSPSPSSLPSPSSPPLPAPGAHPSRPPSFFLHASRATSFLYLPLQPPIHLPEHVTVCLRRTSSPSLSIPSPLPSTSSDFAFSPPAEASSFAHSVVVGDRPLTSSTPSGSHRCVLHRAHACSFPPTSEHRRPMQLVHRRRWPPPAALPPPIPSLTCRRPIFSVNRALLVAPRQRCRLAKSRPFAPSLGSVCCSLKKKFGSLTPGPSCHTHIPFLSLFNSHLHMGSSR